MPATHAVRPAHAGAASSSCILSSSDNFVVANRRLADFVSETPVSFIANNRFFGEFGFYCWVDTKVIPGVVNNFLEIPEFLIVCDNERDAARRGFFFVRK